MGRSTGYTMEGDWDVSERLIIQFSFSTSLTLTLSYTYTHTDKHKIKHKHKHEHTSTYSLFFVSCPLLLLHSAEEEMPTKQMLLQRTEDILKVVRTTNLNW